MCIRDSFQAGSIAQKYNCQLTRLDFQQEEGLMSCLPLGDVYKRQDVVQVRHAAGGGDKTAPGRERSVYGGVRSGHHSVTLRLGHELSLIHI